VVYRIRPTGHFSLGSTTSSGNLPIIRQCNTVTLRERSEPRPAADEPLLLRLPLPQVAHIAAATTSSVDTSPPHPRRFRRPSLDSANQDHSRRHRRNPLGRHHCYYHNLFANNVIAERICIAATMVVFKVFVVAQGGVGWWSNSCSRAPIYTHADSEARIEEAARKNHFN
jgi:hypothetical protein